MILLVACSSNEFVNVKRINNKMKYQLVADNLHILYGGGYRLVKKNNKYVVETFGGLGNDLEPNELYKNDEFTIMYESELDDEHFENKRTYYYVTKDEKIKIYSCEGFKIGNLPSFNYPKSFELDGIVYFVYCEQNDLIINEVKDKELIEFKKMPIIDNEYQLEYYLYDSQHMFVYKGENTKYIIDDEEYIFNNSDHVVILKNYIFYTTYSNNEPLKSYLINRKNQEVKELSNVIDFDINEYGGVASLNNIAENRFMFVENDDDMKYYSYAEVTDSKILIQRLPLEYPKEFLGSTPWSYYSILNETDMVITRQNKDGTFGYHVYMLK